jgi:hypothetical protein
MLNDFMKKIKGSQTLELHSKLKARKKRTYIDVEGGQIHVVLECLDIYMFSFCVHYCHYEFPNVAPGLDKVRVIGQGVGDSWR